MGAASVARETIPGAADSLDHTAPAGWFQSGERFTRERDMFNAVKSYEEAVRLAPGNAAVSIGDEALFGSGAGLVRSQALVRLNVSTGTPPCLLALGSREPDMFHSGMRTELISFLARVLERCIGSWLDLPA